MSARQAARARWIVAFLLGAVVLSFAGSSTAEAGVGEVQQAEGECVDIQRSVFSPPGTIQPPRHPRDFGRIGATSADWRFATTYCFQGGLWRLTADAFPYYSTTECIQVVWVLSDHNSLAPPPSVGPPLAAIDTVAPVHSAVEATTGPENLERYCREGDRWRWEIRPIDTPQGPPEQWAEECKIVNSPSRRPVQTTTDPAELSTLDTTNRSRDLNDRRWQTLDTYIVYRRHELAVYCRNDDRWHLLDIEDFPLDRLLSENGVELRDSPTANRCVRLTAPIDGDITGIDREEDLPAQLPPFADPGDYAPQPVNLDEGSYEELDDFPDLPDGDPAGWRKVYCALDGVWKRGDTIFGSVCRQGEKPLDPGLFPEECWSPFRTRSYEVHYNGGAADNFAWKLRGFWSEAFFGLGRTATQISLWLVEEAYTFDATKHLDTMLDIGDNFEANFVDLEVDGRPIIPNLVYLVLFTWVSLHVLRGRATMAGGELVVSVVLLSLSAFFMAHHANYMRSMFDLMDDASRDLLVAGQGDDPSAGGTGISVAVDGVQQELHSALIAQPLDYLNWGRPLGDAADPNNPLRACAAARDRILAFGPDFDDDAFPREEMARAGCHRESQFNENPSSERLGGAILAGAGNAFTAFFIAGTALTVVIAKFSGLVLGAVAPLALPFAGLPGGGRRIFWLYAGIAGQDVAVVFASSGVLSMFVLVPGRLMSGTDDAGSMVERFFLLFLAAVVVGLARRRVLDGLRRSSGRLVDNLTNVRLGGGGATWQGPSGTQGLNLLNVDRGMQYAGRAAMYGAGYAGLLASSVMVQPVTAFLGSRIEAFAHVRRTNTARRRHDRHEALQTKTYLRPAPTPTAPSPPLSGEGGAGPRGGYDWALGVGRTAALPAPRGASGPVAWGDGTTTPVNSRWTGGGRAAPDGRRAPIVRGPDGGPSAGAADSMAWGDGTTTPVNWRWTGGGRAVPDRQRAPIVTGPDGGPSGGAADSMAPARNPLLRGQAIPPGYETVTDVVMRQNEVGLFSKFMHPWATATDSLSAHFRAKRAARILAERARPHPDGGP